VQSVSIWALGALLAAGGWLIQSHTLLTIGEKVFYLCGLCVAIAVLRFVYFRDLETGFKSQQRVAARLERALGFFTPGSFDSREDPIYPAKWEAAGSTRGGGNYFRGSYMLLYTGTVFLVCAILLNGVVM
jgi:hypothetical protein